MSTIESLDEATLAKEEFSVCGTHWSASDKSNSRRSSHLNGKGTYGNPYGTDHPQTERMKNESTAQSLMRALRKSGLTRLINDICCDSVSLGINEPETHELGGKNTNYNHAMLLRNSGKYAHECESVDTQDSFIRRQSLMSSSKGPNPIEVLEVQRKRKPRRATRSQTAPRQRGEPAAFNMVAPYSTFTPRAEGGSHGMGTEDGVVYRKFPSNGNLNELDKAGHHDIESVSSRSTLTRRSKESLRSRERHTFSSNTRYSMPSSKTENLALPPRVGKNRSSPKLRRSKSSKK